jgi:uncharacterized protein
MNLIIVSICTWAIAQSIKFVIILIQKKQFDFRAFVATGGMPSAHSAIVSSLATSVAIIDGFDSVTFGISVVLALIVMYDAAGVRRSVGKQAVVLNRIVKELKERRTIASYEYDLRELIGHTTFQVAIGACLGIGVSFFWFILIA